MKYLLALISLLQLSALSLGGIPRETWWIPSTGGLESCRSSPNGCQNACAQRGRNCCFCDTTRDFDLRACFCCPKNYVCCPSDLWSGGYAHCCPSGSACTSGGRCAVEDDIPGVPAVGYSGFQCRTDSYVYVTVDNSFSMFIDGVEQKLSNPSTWEVADKVLIPSTARLITICATNELYKAGILISSEDPDLLARATWKCVSSVQKCPGWWTNLECSDERWSRPVPDEYNNGLGTRLRAVPYIPTNTRWVWCNASNTTLTKEWAPACTCRIWLPGNGDGY